MRILFVDDLPDTRDVFRIAFKVYGHSVRLAANGVEAIAAVQEEQFDAIIMDIEMPGMNGWDAVREIRTLPNGQQTPIIMFTAYGNGEHRREALEMGANSLLHKPLLPQELISHVAQFV